MTNIIFTFLVLASELVDIDKKYIHFSLFESLRMLSGNIPNMHMQKLS